MSFHLRRWLATGLIACAWAGTAQGHATLDPAQAPVGSYVRFAIRVPHGCQGSPTLAVRVALPEGVVSVKPMPKPGWQLTSVAGPYASAYDLHGKSVTSGVRELVWTGRLADEHYDEFVFQAHLAKSLPAGTSLSIPVVQECEQGQARWTAPPASAGHDHGGPQDGPAPQLLLHPAR